MIDGTTGPSPSSVPTTLHDILVAWQRGALTARQAMAMSGIDTVAELVPKIRCNKNSPKIFVKIFSNSKLFL